MNDPQPARRRAKAWASVWITAVLMAAAAVSLGYRLSLSLSRDDSDVLESPLALAVARQLVAGPWELYGPFGGRNPLVLIHAPLYYRLTALAAWPLTRAGLEPETASLVAGRSLSLLGLLLALWAAYRLARLDGSSREVGWWSVLLVAAAPVLGGLPFTVRPDMLGVGLQTTGVLLVLATLRAERPRQAPLMAAFAAFGLALCIKQHFVAAPLISTFLLLAASRRGRLPAKFLERSLLLTTAIVVAIYGAEELVTGGRMSRAVFVAAASAGRIHPGDLVRVEIVSVAVIGRSVGLLALWLAAALVMVRTRRGLGRWIFAATGNALVTAIVALACLRFTSLPMWVEQLMLDAELPALVVLAPACILLGPRSLLGGRLDAALWAYCAGELVLMTALCWASSGAWINYAIQGVVFASVLTARALARAWDATVSFPRPLLLPALAVLSAAFIDVAGPATERQAERESLAHVFDLVGRDKDEFFFVDRPGDNRVHGRPDLVYDTWLYPVFEALGLAEPRSVWLRSALRAGPVHVVVTTSENPRIDGLDQTLPELGFLPTIRVGSFFVWERAGRSRHR